MMSLNTQSCIILGCALQHGFLTALPSECGSGDVCAYNRDGFLVPACPTIASAFPPTSLESMKSVHFQKISLWLCVKVENTLIIGL